MLEVHDLHTHFKTDDGLVKAVDGVSFTMKRGERLGIVGESGSGKSVTALSIMQLLPVPPAFHPAGAIHFEGKSVFTHAAGLRGNQMSMIFQDPMTSLNPFLTVERQLTEVLEAHRNISRADARREAIAMVERVGIPDGARRIREYPHQFSGGMRQRVMIAMALMCKPALLIADEPTTALDVTIQAQILELIGELNRDLGTSVILITHDLGVVAGMTDRIAVMYAGRIVEEAPTDELFAQPKHPYTRGLLSSIPRLDQRSEQLVPIPGLPPDLSNLPPGCLFHPRCPDVVDRCRVDYPTRVKLSGQHWAACWEVKK